MGIVFYAEASAVPPSMQSEPEQASCQCVTYAFVSNLPPEFLKYFLTPYTIYSLPSLSSSRHSNGLLWAHSGHI